MTAKARLLYVTDLAYQAAGRRYCDEDIYLSERLRTHFFVALCHPRDVADLMASFDVVVVRNSGPAQNYRADYDTYRQRAGELGKPFFNELTGRADQAGKQYLVDLYALGFPVIPTVDTVAGLDRLPAREHYVVKPKDGADSVGLRFVDRTQLAGLDTNSALVQPRIDFSYEVSFYFVDDVFQYALYAPDPTRRWQLERYEPSVDDLAFARQFISWNRIVHGIQRVDACRTRDGALLLVELEDLNPYLSLDRTTHQQRETFIAAMIESIGSLARR